MVAFPREAILFCDLIHCFTTFSLTFPSSLLKLSIISVVRSIVRRVLVLTVCFPTLVGLLLSSTMVSLCRLSQIRPVTLSFFNKCVMLEQAQVHTWLKLCLLAIDHRCLLDALISVSVCFRGWVGWCVLVPLFTFVNDVC